MNLRGLGIPTGQRQTSWLFTSMAKDSNLGLLEQIQLAVRVGHQLGASDLQVQHSVHSATLPPVAALYAIINYQFKTNELKNLEKLVKQTVQALKPY